MHDTTDTSLSLRQACELYFASLHHLDAGTLKNQRSKILRFVAWCETGAELPCTTWLDVTPPLLDCYALHRLRTAGPRGVLPKPDTVQRDLMAVRTLLAWCEERELTGPIRSAHALRPLPRQEREEIHVVTPAQERIMLNAARWIAEGNHSLRFPADVKGRPCMVAARQTGWRPGAFRLYLLLMLRCGLRPAEALKLRWDELRLDDSPPLIRLRRRFNEQGRVIRKLKTAKSEDAITIARRVPVHARDQWAGPSEDADVVAELLAHRQQLRDAGELGAWVFGRDVACSDAGEFPDDAFIWRALKHETGDARLRAYSCRHTLGTRLAARGFSSEQIARVLRNTPRVCERHYIAGTRELDAFDVQTGQRVQVCSA